MIVDVRTYTMVPGRLGAWLKLYEAEGMPIHVRHLDGHEMMAECRPTELLEFELRTMTLWVG